jgi:hypothetical protein
MDKKSIGRSLYLPLTCINPGSHFPAMAPSQADGGLFDLDQNPRISLEYAEHGVQNFPAREMKAQR